MATFKIGDCVKLKHGAENVKMTIDQIEHNPIDKQTVVRCKWFDETEKNFFTEGFSPQSLVHCEDSK